MLSVSLGGLFLLLGIIGVVLPVLPTTPFLLLACCFFAKGSTRVDRWFRSTGIYQKYVEDYRATGAMTLSQKLKIQIAAGTVMAVSFLLIEHPAARIGLAVGFLIHNFVFIFVIPTKKIENEKGKES